MESYMDRHVRWMESESLLDRDFDSMARYDIDCSFIEEPYQAKPQPGTSLEGKIIRREVQRKEALGQARNSWQRL